MGDGAIVLSHLKAFAKKNIRHRACPGGGSGKDILYNNAFHVSESSFKAVVVERQSFMIEPQQVQNCGVEVVDGADIFHCFVSEFICRAVTERGFDAGAGHPAGEAFRIVVSPTGPFLECRHPAEFGAPDDQRVFQQATLFQVRDQRGRWLIQNRTMDAVLIFQYLVAVPVAESFATCLVRAVEQLHKPNALL